MSRICTEIHPLLTKEIIDSLYNKHIYTIYNFLDAEITQIAVLTNLTYKEILTIRRHIVNKYSAVIRNGFDYYNELRSKTQIPTGITSIDNLLVGGLMVGNVYEICGYPCSGKTQFCLTLVKNIAQNGETVFYIDTKRDFSCSKIKKMLEASKILNEQIREIMSRILVKRPDTKFQLINTFYQIKSDVSRDLKVQVVIVDSLPALFYQSDDISKNYGIINQCVNIMRFMAIELNIAFVVTNIVTSSHEGNLSEETFLSSEKIGLGKYWLTVPQTRLMFRKSAGEENYEITVVKSNRLPLGKTCVVFINNTGML